MRRIVRLTFAVVGYLLWMLFIATVWVLAAMVRIAQREARRGHVNRHRVAEFVQPSRSPYDGIHGRAERATPTYPNPQCTVCAGSGTDPLFHTDCTECWPEVRVTSRLRRHFG